MDKVSVIVPIYKVEKYLHRCLNSILQQTYCNLEIILVDDGSPDASGKIADQYAERDKRIRVFHKDNGGLSDARNAGMELANGKFIMFVDSDDWLDIRMIDEMLYYENTYQADIIQSAFYYAYEDHLLFDRRYLEKDKPVTMLCSPPVVMEELLHNQRVKNFAWGKLFKTAMIKDLPFKKGVLFEDVFWAYQVMHRANSLLLINRPLYYYYQRSDSIVSHYSVKNLDIIDGLKERHAFIEKNYPDLCKESYRSILTTSFDHYMQLLLRKKITGSGQKRKEIRRYVKLNLVPLKMAARQDWVLYRRLILFSLHPSLSFLYLACRKMLRKLKRSSRSLPLQKIDYKREGDGVHEPL
ncbi:glycosyltransferase [Bacillaceae bacterium Marseille-Q3522]|nr:glycosyltransferase [Bacillaceae bacterium Marseille-Q3522]